jgi:hypothetical protein
MVPAIKNEREDRFLQSRSASTRGNDFFLFHLHFNCVTLYDGVNKSEEIDLA